MSPGELQQRVARREDQLELLALTMAEPPAGIEPWERRLDRPARSVRSGAFVPYDDYEQTSVRES